MTFFTKVQFPTSSDKISYTDNLLAIGSCFADSMSTKFKERAFSIRSNPNGIIYHPLVIAQSLERIAFGKAFELNELQKNRDELWHSWDHHSSFSHPERETALKKMNAAFEVAHHRLLRADWLIITFGTAYGYRLHSNNKLVANCHKYPAADFEKELSETEALIATYTNLIPRLKEINSKLKIILTVSPIRHKKDGLVNNNRSKSRLLILAEKLEQQFDYCQYFPSFEYLMDELRDYRFYNSDLLHPSLEAQEFIWEKFSAAYFNEDTQKMIAFIMKFVRAANHRPLFPNTSANQFFREQTLAELNAFALANTSIDLSEIIKKFQD